MKRADLLALAGRIEAAAEGEQRELFTHIAARLSFDKQITPTIAARIITFAAAEAYESAAAALVPAGWAWCVHDVGIASAMRAPCVVKTTAATPALALTAAALRAMSEEMP